MALSYVVDLEHYAFAAAAPGHEKLAINGRLRCLQLAALRLHLLGEMGRDRDGY